MHRSSKIEWTESTWNPVTGCTKISAGCLNCYAERMANRLHLMGQPHYKNGFSVTTHPDILDAPRSWKKPQTIFVNSMSDLFHEEVPERFIQQIFFVMRACPQHTFQILTKRSQRLKELAPNLRFTPNIWIGVTVENQDSIFRIDDLRTVNTSIRFLSCEPLIGPIKGLNLNDIHWVIAGGESGPKSRPVQIEWVRDIKQACQNQNVPFFFKQWGGVNKKKAGRELDGKIWNEMPELAYAY